MDDFAFQVLGASGKARVGVLRTPHGTVRTPAFMPVGTAGTVKGVTPDQLKVAGAEMILANTYHLLLRPGPATVAALGGLHAVMGWDGPILTDSGGYQVFSLADLRAVDDAGVTFRSHIDGAEVRLTPAGAVETQRLLGADVIMQLDECPPAGADRETVARAVRRSAAWAALCREAWQSRGEDILSSHPLPANPAGQMPAGREGRLPSPRTGGTPSPRQALFGIQQGGVFADLRAESAARLVELDLPGYAVGGLSVGEGHEAMVGVLDAIDGQLPRDRPRYLMGVGEPRDILAGVLAGIDLFDCVLPTRNGRNAQAFTFGGRVRLRNARWSADTGPIEDGCDCYACRRFSRGTLRHLFAAREMLAPTLVSIHNLRFFSRLMDRIRAAVAEGSLAQAAPAWMEKMYAGEGVRS
jgi:queuine tRNA-ribosyltransferase